MPEACKFKLSLRDQSADCKQLGQVGRGSQGQPGPPEISAILAHISPVAELPADEINCSGQSYYISALLSLIVGELTNRVKSLSNL